MQQSYNDTAFITHNDEIVGLSLGYQSGVTEHECGIRGVMDRLGVEGFSPEKGMAGYALPAKWRDSPLHLVEGSRGAAEGGDREPFTALVVASDRAEAMRLAGSYAGRPRRWSDAQAGESVTAWWDDKGFVVFAWTDEAAGHLRGLSESVFTGSLALMSAKSGPFGGGGPILVRLDRAVDKWKAINEQRMKGHRDLEEWKSEWRKETDGLFGDLARMGKWLNRESGRNWGGFPAFACALYNDDKSNRYRTGWYSNPRVARTEDGIPIVWVNPEHQDLFSCGWFTAKDLRGWADGTGRMWPLCASLPAASHPFWRWINGQLPEKPDNVYSGGSWDWEVSLNEPAHGLLRLEGVDEALAAKIVAERERGGEFKHYTDFEERCPAFARKVLDDNEYHVTCLPQTWDYRLPNFPERDGRGDLAIHQSFASKGLWGWAYEKFGFRSSDGGRHPAFHPVFHEERSAGVEAGLSTHVVVYDREKFDAMMKSWREIAEAYPEWGFDPHFWGRATERNMSLKQRIGEESEIVS